ncbi:MAG: DUF4129 domain-containing protein [Caldilineaceae bacterium]
MLLTNRRHRLIFIFLAGMEVAWFLPFVLTLAARWRPEMLRMNEAATQALDNLLGAPPLAMVLLFWLTLLGYMLAADLLNRWLILSPQREVVLLALTLLTMLGSIRLTLYPTAALFDLSWVGSAFGSVFNYTAGWRPELALIIANGFLWWRVAMNSGRDLTFLSVGMSFRLGMLLALLGNGLLTGMAHQPAGQGVQYFWLFFGFGLAAVALVRIDEKTVVGDHSVGAILPWPRMGQIGASVLAVLGLGAAATAIYNPENIRTFLGWFAPLWSFLGVVLLRILAFLLWLISPLLEWLVATMRGLLANAEFLQPQAQETTAELGQQEPVEFTSLAEMMSQWALLRYCLVTLGIVIVVGLLWLFFVKTRQRQLTEEAEELAQGEIDLGGNLLQRGLDRLRDWAALWSRYGLSNQLLAAISIQNIYANLSRVARQRGFPRPLNQPPDQYLPTLTLAFPTEYERLARITNAYMRVHYGDLPVDEGELSQLRTDYQHILETPNPQT